MRLLRHLFAPRTHILLPEAAMQRVTAAVANGEQRHSGQICFAIESALSLRQVIGGYDARARAEEVFARLRVWDTELNNGVLIYLLLADHRIEIVADRGLRDKVSERQWRHICARMQPLLAGGQAEAAVLLAVDDASALLAEHFPRQKWERASGVNELADRPHLL